MTHQLLGIHGGTCLSREISNVDKMAEEPLADAKSPHDGATGNGFARSKLPMFKEFNHLVSMLAINHPESTSCVDFTTAFQVVDSIHHVATMPLACKDPRIMPQARGSQFWSWWHSGSLGRNFLRTSSTCSFNSR